MFERRLRWFSAGVALLAFAIVARLVDIQIVRAEQYEALADRLLTQRKTYWPAPRGSILDRDGRTLVSDRPTFDVSVAYAVLALEASDEPYPRGRQYVRAVARELRKAGRFPQDWPTDRVVGALEPEIDAVWQEIADLTGNPVTDLLEQAAYHVRRIELIRRQCGQPIIKEEHWFHPVASGLDNATGLKVRLALGDCPWVVVVPSTERLSGAGPAFAHLLGKLGAADTQRIASDPLRDDELRGLMEGDRCGISGVERVAETELRGVRGLLVEDFDRSNVIQRLEPVRGDDVSLTIDADLQRRVYDLLGDTVRALNGGDPRAQNPVSGASAVAIDVVTRDVLALVSYPSYEPADFEREYERLRTNYRFQPTRFRAVSNIYPPGSTCKAITLVAGLAEGVISPYERIHCTGMLLPGKPNHFRCWIYNRYGTTHDASHNPAGQDGEDAIRNSCNIYFFKVGDRLGPERLCDWFGRFGFGRTQGTGLIEESPGIVPTAGWIAANRTDGRPQPADAWNWSIGQGEVSATPLQVANVAATVAAGRWAPVKLVRDAAGQPVGDDRVAEPVPFDDAHLKVLRTGMWRVVNERGGTATRARLDNPDYVICGKTGSAQAVPHPVRYRWTVEWPDGRRQEVVAGIEERDLFAALHDPRPRPKIAGYRTVERYPPWEEGQKLPSHAWFIGFTQAVDTPRGARPQGATFAIAVIVEYGGSGGQVAGPVAKQIAEWLLEDVGPPEYGRAPTGTIVP